MNETERIELLRAVAECAPKEMGAQLICGNVEFEGTPRSDEFPPCLTLRNELPTDDAEACFVMLDAMDKSGWGTVVSTELVNMPWYLCSAVNHDGDTFTYGGPTRAEAVSRAFVAVFGGK